MKIAGLCDYVQPSYDKKNLLKITKPVLPDISLKLFRKPTCSDRERSKNLIGIEDRKEAMNDSDQEEEEQRDVVYL